MNGILSHVLPVIDLQGRIVVRGVAGQRADYQPIRSQLVRSADPGQVAKALHHQYGFEAVYVADLDAIAGNEPDWESYKSIAATGMKLWIDAGIGTSRCAQSVATRSVSLPLERMIVGLESLGDPFELRDLTRKIGVDRAVFSLDLQDGQPQTSIRDWDLEAIIAEVISAGFQSMIVLDLASVGVSAGPVTGTLCRRLRQQHPQIELVSGGGIRGPDDVLALVQAGCDRVLVASALHDGCLS